MSIFHRKSRPRIGITKPIQKRVNLQYLILWFSIWLGGGKPKVLNKLDDSELSAIHGLILGGGTDVYPGLFFKDPKPDYPYDMQRDELELRWLRLADIHRIPVFAICRGAQLMNVYNGGTLHLDMAAVYENVDYPDTVISYWFFRKPIHIEPQSLCGRIFGKERMMVNSIHKQSIDRPGDSLVVTAREPNGVVQAIERPEQSFYLGVQFHPERLIYKHAFRSFFNRFIGCAREHLAVLQSDSRES